MKHFIASFCLAVSFVVSACGRAAPSDVAIRDDKTRHIKATVPKEAALKQVMASPEPIKTGTGLVIEPGLRWDAGGRLPIGPELTIEEWRKWGKKAWAEACGKVGCAP